MKPQRNVNKIFVAVVLVLMMTLSAVSILPGAIAATITPISVPISAYITVAPSPIGVNQQAAVMFWLGDAPPTATGPGGDRWQNFTLTITTPSGTNETKGPFTSDDVGGSYCTYAPTTTGTYHFQMSFPGQWINTTTYQRWYQPATTKSLALTVQQAQVTGTPDNLLPTGYWQRPIDAENRQWYQIGGNWLMAKGDTDAVAFEGSGNWNRYSQGPESAHIVWTRELTQGGIIGGSYGYGMSYYTGLQYEPLLTPPIIINGILYHNTAEVPRYGFEAVDLRTGKQIWYQNSTNQLSFGQVFEYDSPNQHGGLAYLWSVVGSTWHMYDAYTGNYILSISNVPSGLKTYGPNGELLVYTLNTAGHWLSMWNSSQAIPPPPGGGTNDWMWRPDNWRGRTLNGTAGIQWNVTGNTAPSGSSLQWFWSAGNVVISTATITVPNQANPVLVQAGFDAKNGTQLWIQNRTDMGLMVYPVYITPNEGVYALFVRESKQWVAWSAKTGDEVWRTDPIEDDWGSYEVCGGFAYGMFYSAGYDGAIHAYNATTGKHVWDFFIGSSGFDTPYGSWPLFGAIVFADNKIYIATNEHSPSTPLWLGEKLYCVDATTGQGLWNVSGMYAGGRNGLGAIADGYFVTANGYDNRIYTFGKGQSAITVTAVAGIGNIATLQGEVTDQSPGQTSLGIPAAGTPAISDQYMSQWMAYLYMQQPKPTNATGVPVTLTISDQNGNIVDTINTQSNINGHYGVSWVPKTTGTYTVTASFTGSKSYYASADQTTLSVGQQPAAAVTNTPTPAPTQTQNPTTTSPAATTTTQITPTASPSAVVNTGTSFPTETLLIATAATIIIIAVTAAAIMLRKRQ